MEDKYLNNIKFGIRYHDYGAWSLNVGGIEILFDDLESAKNFDNMIYLKEDGVCVASLNLQQMTDVMRELFIDGLVEGDWVRM